MIQSSLFIATDNGLHVAIRTDDTGRWTRQGEYRRSHFLT